ncbi:MULTISPECIES: hypothetical protein, partial [unclassified Vibrio]|uniref:hypothetical protein n=1 Tax=unclassified Vibrio TaxID=2614977 RepID=UPI0027CD9C8E
ATFGGMIRMNGAGKRATNLFIDQNNDGNAWINRITDGGEFRPLYKLVVHNDSRLSNAREWTADVVSQTEAEVGAATTARKWTAQRVRQAIIAWWDSIPKGTAFNKNFGSTAGTVCPGNDSRLSDAREWLANTVSQAEAEAGQSATPRKWTAQRVRQAINKYGLGVWSQEFLNDVSVELQSGMYGFTSSDPSGIATFGGMIRMNGAGKRATNLFIDQNNDGNAWINRITDGGEFRPLYKLMTDADVIGTNQSWLNVTSSRSSGITYTNNTGRPLMIVVTTGTSSNGSGGIEIIVNSVIVAAHNPSSNGFVNSFSLIVPKDGTYRANLIGNMNLASWSELR